MPVAVRSFGKINIGLQIGPRRPDGFHELRTVYQTIALHDLVRVEVGSGSGIEIRCQDERVPRDHRNTCWRMAEQAARRLGVSGRIVIEIEKNLAVQGGLGAASSNAVATMLALEKLAGQTLDQAARFQIASGIGSDVPLFLLGGTVLGLGRGEEVYSLPDLPEMALVVVTPEVGVSTPKAFADWDRTGRSTAEGCGRVATGAKLTGERQSARINEFSHRFEQWLSGTASGVPVESGGNRVESSARWAQPLLDLVRTGIENDFERVVFPEYPELSEVKQNLYEQGAQYASLSGSGSSLYGVFASAAEAERAAANLGARGLRAQPTRTVGRKEFRDSAKKSET